MMPRGKDRKARRMVGGTLSGAPAPEFFWGKWGGKIYFRGEK